MKKVVITIIAIGVIIVGSSFLLRGKVQAPIKNNGQQQSQIQQQSQTEQISKKNKTGASQSNSDRQVVYTNSGYSPAELIVNIGDTVIWKNESSQSLWTASSLHPVHGAYGGTSLQEHCPDKENNDFDECKSSQTGELWPFTFNKAGTWKYHNHLNPSHFGQVIVK